MACPSFHREEFDPPNSGNPDPVRNPNLIAITAWIVTNGVAIGAAVLSALLMTGCANLSGIQPTSKLMQENSVTLKTAPRQAAQQSVWPSTNWWESFGDPQLNALIEQSINPDEGNPTLRLAQARLSKANAVAGIAESASGITKTLNASSTREKFSENYIYPPPLGGSIFTINQLALDFNYDLDFWGRNRAAIAAAHAQVEASAADAAAARLALTTSVARAWVQLKRLYAQRDVAIISTQQREQVLTLTRQRSEAGLDTVAELRQAQAGTPIAALEVAQLDEAIALVRNQLAALIGKGPDYGRQIPQPQPDFQDAMHQQASALPNNLELNLLGRRADLTAARWRVEAALHDIDQAKAQFYPNINLMASISFLSLGGSRFLDASSLNPSIGPALSLPLFSGSLRSNLRGKTADYDAAVEQYNQTLLDAAKDVADQITSLQAVQNQVMQQQQALERTTQAYDVALTRYRAGISNYLTVLNAQTAVLSQQRAANDLSARGVDLKISLIRALGGGFSQGPSSTQLH